MSETTTQAAAAEAPPPQCKDIHAAQLEVMRRVGYVRKTDGKSPQNQKGPGYLFAGEAQILQAVRPCMIDMGVVVSPAEIVVERQETYTTKGGSTMNQVRIRVRFDFTHVASGTTKPCWIVGEASDAGDKAASKAETIAFKYALRQFFMLETGDDPDKYNPEGRSGAAQNQQDDGQQQQGRHQGGGRQTQQRRQNAPQNQGQQARQPAQGQQASQGGDRSGRPPKNPQGNFAGAMAAIAKCNDLNVLKQHHMTINTRLKSGAYTPDEKQKLADALQAKKAALEGAAQTN